MSHNTPFKIVTWSIIAGTAIALSAEVTLNFLGIGLGLTSVDMTASSLFKTGMGSIIWLSVSGIITMLLGGWIAGKVANHLCAKTRMLHGILAWSFATLITVMVSTSAAGVMIGGSTNVIKSSINSVGRQSIAATAEYAGASDSPNTPTENTVSNKTSDEATNNLGMAAISMFIAFVLSAFASALGAWWAEPKLNPDM